MSSNGSVAQKESNKELKESSKVDVYQKNGVSSGIELHTQCGGHKLGFVDIGNGFILKKLQTPPRGIHELNFYEKVFNPLCEDQDLIDLRQFLPPYYGLEVKNNAQFLKLKNLTSQFRQPCLADIKVGRVTYDQVALPAKIQSETNKWPPRTKIGFGFTGMIVHNPKTQRKQSYDKTFGLELTEKDIVKKGLGTYYGLDQGHLRHKVIRSHLRTLRRLEVWFLRQRKFSFIASSLLLVYEGDVQAGTIEGERLHSVGEKHKFCAAADADNGSELHGKCETGELMVKKLHPSDDCIVEHSSAIQNNNNNSQTESSLPPEGNMTSPDDSDVANVWLIDFAHAFPATELDENVLFGLKNLINSMEQLLTMSS